MKRPRESCETIRVELSAQLDGEISPATARVVAEHLETCSACRQYEDSLHSLRRRMRLQALEPVPDLTERIRHEIENARPAIRRAAFWGHLRAGAVAAAATIILLVGSSLPWRGGGDVAAAAEITAGIRAAARALGSYGASFEIVEVGLAPATPRRRFVAEVRFEGPERFSLRVRDETPVTAGYRRQHYEHIAGPSRSWGRAPGACVALFPGTCSSAPVQSLRVRRQPFDGTTTIPTDIVLPLESIASARGFTVLGHDHVLGRACHQVALDYATAEPLIRSLDPFEVWRPVHPLDRVEICLDAETWFPLGFSVTASESPQRRAWSARLGLDDAPGETLLDVVATRVSDSAVEVPAPPRRGDAFDGGFRTTPWRAIRGGPREVADLPPYRSGVSAAGERVSSYASGLSWIRVTAGRGRNRAPADLLGAEEIELRDRSFAYYAPASIAAPRRIEIYGSKRYLRIESNLPRATLVDVARSVSMRGLRQDRIWNDGTETRRFGAAAVRREHRFVRWPGAVPAGYSFTGAWVTSGAGSQRTVVMYYRLTESESHPGGIRITQVAPITALPPTSEEPVVVQIGPHIGRWSIERGELEWIVGSAYRAISVPNLDLELALQIARELSA